MEPFKRKSLNLMYDGHIIAVYEDILETPDGRIVKYDFIRHKTGGGAGILLVDKDESVYLIKQYRNSVNDIALEIPAGGYSGENESGEVCAVREAEEETGWIPQKVYHVANMISSIGTYDEWTDVFIGTDLAAGKIKPDPEEFIELVHIPMDEAMQMIREGKIVDSKTLVALFAYQEFKRKGIISEFQS